MDRLEKICAEKGLRMTEQRRIITRVISNADDHPDVEEIYRRAAEIDSRISIATVYRTMRLLEEYDVVQRHDFQDGHGRARYEEATEQHHDHLINVKSGDVIEFVSHEIEKLQEKIAREHGFKLVDHRLELYGVPLDDAE
ncbi:MAG: Fur family transcriptional regulator [Pseudomonadota bacterium]